MAEVTIQITEDIERIARQEGFEPQDWILHLIAERIAAEGKLQLRKARDPVTNRDIFARLPNEYLTMLKRDALSHKSSTSFRASLSMWWNRALLISLAQRRCLKLSDFK